MGMITVSVSAIWIISTLLTFITALLAFIGKNVWDFIKEMRDRQDEQQEEMQEIKDNYLSRFEKVNKNISDSRENILEEMYEVKLLLAKTK